MGCCSSKRELEDPPIAPARTSAASAPSDRNSQPGPSPVISSLPPVAKSDSLAPKRNADPGKRGRYESTPGPLPKNLTRITLEKRERVVSAPSHASSYRRKTAVNICLEALNILNSTLSTVPIPALSAAPMVLSAAIQRVQVRTFRATILTNNRSLTPFL
jgi:hypothetical protein